MAQKHISIKLWFEDEKSLKHSLHRGQTRKHLLKR